MDEFEYEALHREVVVCGLWEVVAPIVLSKREMTHFFIRASDVIGREDDKENIVSLLKQSSDDDENVYVIIIVRIGRLGKTTCV